MEPERWLPIPNYPQIEVSDRGNVRKADTHEPLRHFYWHGFLCVRVGSAPRTIHNLVASLHLPNRPPDATHAFFLTPDRQNCAASNLSWTKPDRRPIERKTGRPMPAQLVYALNARIKKGGVRRGE